LPAYESLDSCTPLVSPVFSEAAVTAPQTIEAVNDLDAHEVFGPLIAKLPLHPQPKWSAVPYGQIGAVHRMAEDGLWTKCVDEMDTLVVPATAIERLLQLIGAMEDGEAGIGFQRSCLKHKSKPSAGRTSKKDCSYLKTTN
jgi:hypothetical protein